MESGDFSSRSLPAAVSVESEDTPPELIEAAEEVRSGQRYRLTVRTLLDWFQAARRGHRVVAKIRSALEDVGLATSPDFEGEWIDAEITLIDKSALQENEPGVDEQPVESAAETLASEEIVATESPPSKPAGPTHRLGKLKAANTPPERAAPDEPLERAITRMLTKDFSQLPVMTSDREIKGVVSWKTIGSRLVLGRKCRYVRDCMEPHQELRVDASIFDAIRVIAEHDFVLVRGRDQKISGIVTATDINDQFRQLAEPFLLLADIETQLRNLIGPKFSAEELQRAKDPSDENRQVQEVADLTFGEYLRLLENGENWERLGLQLDRKTFIKDLERIRDVRNDVMHFDPDPMGSEDTRTLRAFAMFLTRLQNLTG